ncbi:hypothetical protein Q7P37_000351 [Cladosporium fusiforme]
MRTDLSPARPLLEDQQRRDSATLERALPDLFDDEPRLHTSTKRWQPRWHFQRFGLVVPRRISHSWLVRHRRYLIRRSRRLAILIFAVVTGLSIFCAILFPSYSNPPTQYKALRARVRDSVQRTGSANLHNETVFIAASLYDPNGRLLSGLWGSAVLRLVDLLGPSNVYVSIYENQADDQSEAAIEWLKSQLPRECNSSLVNEELDTSNINCLITGDGLEQMSRIAFLAEVRNRALNPLTTDRRAAAMKFDRVLFLNDVLFDPVDAANLLFSTNANGETGKADYLAACATDFINPFKFYDTFATRDLEGNNMGVPLYPWFSGAGEAVSRWDVLTQRDAVRVKSCWGGMVAFEARWFQRWFQDKLGTDVETRPGPLRFRSERELYWEASECCLIHADLAAMASDSQITSTNATKIFINPYIRVAYSKTTFDLLPYIRRVERVLLPIQIIANWIGGRPSFNARRLEKPGHQVSRQIWNWDAASERAAQKGEAKKLPEGMQGSYKPQWVVGTPGGFCGERMLMCIGDSFNGSKRSWTLEAAPPV